MLRNDFLKSVQDKLILMDYYLHGSKGRIFMFGVFSIVLIAPILDTVLQPRNLSLTYLSTLIFIFFLLFSLVIWLLKLSDSDGKVSLLIIKHRLILGKENLVSFISNFRGKDGYQNLFLTGFLFLVGGFIFKAIQNASELFRHTFINLDFLIRIEKMTSIGYLIILLGVLILVFLHFKDSRFNLFDIFIKKKSNPHKVELTSDLGTYVYNLKDEAHISPLLSINPDFLFKNTVSFLSDWARTNLKSGKLEKEYEIELSKFLQRRFSKDKSITAENKGVPVLIHNQIYRHGNGEKGYIDMSIDDAIFIELKNNINNKGIENAMSQLKKYQNILAASHLPLLIIFIGNNYDHVKDKISNFLKDHNKRHFQKIIAFVVEIEK
jgi:hypothetical protein